MDSYRPASLFAPAPPRRLTLEPADDDKQDREKRDHREKKLKLSIGAEQQRVHADQSEVTRQHRPALPGRRRTPAPAVAFCRKPILHDRLLTFRFSSLYRSAVHPRGFQASSKTVRSHQRHAVLACVWRTAWSGFISAEP